MSKITIRTFACLGATALAFLPEASKALTTVPFTFNGSGTYNCNTNQTCNIVATDFILLYDENAGQWSPASYGAGTLRFTNTTNSTFFEYVIGGVGGNGSVDPGAFKVTNPLGDNTLTSLTLSNTTDLSSYFTIFFSAPPATPPGQPLIPGNYVYTLTGIGAPVAGAPLIDSSTLPVANFSTISGTIAGQSAPAPLGLLAILPLIRFVNRRKKLTYSF